MPTTLQPYVNPHFTPMPQALPLISTLNGFTHSEYLDNLKNNLSHALNKTEKMFAALPNEGKSFTDNTGMKKLKRNKRNDYAKMLEMLNDDNLLKEQSRLGCLKKEYKKNGIPPSKVFPDGEVYSNLRKAGNVINSKNHQGFTALMYAASNTGPTDMVGPLCKAGADPNLQDNEGCTALIWFIKSTFPDNFNKNNQGLIHKIHIIDILKNFKADINKSDNIGFTPLMYAVVGNDLQIVQKLIDLGAKTDFVNKEGKTALHLAVKYKSSQGIFDVLNKKTVNINVKDKNGHTPFMLAVFRGDIDIMETFMYRTIDINDTDARDWTVLMHAVNCGDIATVENLLHYHANVTFKNKSGKSALMIALERGNMGMVNVLSNAGAYIPETKKQPSQTAAHAGLVFIHAPYKTFGGQITSCAASMSTLLPAWLAKGVDGVYQTLIQIVARRPSV